MEYLDKAKYMNEFRPLNHLLRRDEKSSKFFYSVSRAFGIPTTSMVGFNFMWTFVMVVESSSGGNDLVGWKTISIHFFTARIQTRAHTLEED